MEGNKLLGLLWLLCTVVFLTECVRNDTRRRRRQSCPDGTYKGDNFECCLCPKGQYLDSDCKSNWTEPTCYWCQNGTFQDHPNSERQCELCKKCGSTENMMEDRHCTTSSNTVCRCQDGHYCDKGDECKVCYACSTCEFGVKVPCSLTNDTQCNQKAPERSNLPPAVTAIIVIAPMMIIILITVIVLWKKKLPCFKQPQKLENLKLLEPLNDPDLQEMLPKIAEILGFKVVRMVVRRQAFPQAMIDNIMDENPRDAGEWAYQLLKAWYEKHGMKGASTALCDNLIEINMRSKAEVVHKLIKDEISRRELEPNGNV